MLVEGLGKALACLRAGVAAELEVGSVPFLDTSGVGLDGAEENEAGVSLSGAEVRKGVEAQSLGLCLRVRGTLYEP